MFEKASQKLSGGSSQNGVLGLDYSTGGLQKS